MKGIPLRPQVFMGFLFSRHAFPGTVGNADSAFFNLCKFHATPGIPWHTPGTSSTPAERVARPLCVTQFSATQHVAKGTKEKSLSAATMALLKAAQVPNVFGPQLLASVLAPSPAPS